ncbi:hypothetical protein GGI04_000266 [Coemansia thaxteri]|nr:hypothetical protein GGI04_000266 [Coemansia thaxteri]
MPVFTPINPPPPPLLSAEASAIEAAVRPTASEHIEERIRDLVQEYQEALWTWAKGLLGDALKSLKSLSGDALICTEQEPHIESECNAYCAEYGGVSMTHLRFLVFSNLGYAYVAAAGEQSSASLFASGLGVAWDPS